MDSAALHSTVHHFRDAEDFKTHGEVLELYRGTFEFAPVLHQILTGNDMMHLYVARQHDSVIRGAAVLKSPEVMMPIGAGVTPLAWVISDIITHPQTRRRGVALHLVRTLCGVVRRQGGRIIYLFADQANEPANHLYIKAGFERLRDQGRHSVFAFLIKE